jgi:hypothetical protein
LGYVRGGGVGLVGWPGNRPAEEALSVLSDVFMIWKEMGTSNYPYLW